LAFAAGMASASSAGGVRGSSRPDDAAALMLPVIVCALLLQRGACRGLYDTGVASYAACRSCAPCVELRGLAEIRRARIGAGCLLAGKRSRRRISSDRAGAFCTQAVIAGMVAVSSSCLSGWAGQISLGRLRSPA